MDEERLYAGGQATVEMPAEMEDARGARAIKTGRYLLERDGQMK